MERRDEPPVTNYERQDLGIGGKFRKPSSRKPPASPYARPATAKPAGERRDEGGGSWFSKIVDPAYRLISSGSTRILPSFFSRSPSSNAVPTSDSIDHDSDGVLSDDDEEKGNLKLTFGSSGEAGPSKGGDVERGDVNYEQVQNDKGTCPGVNGLSEIEQLLKGKTLSRDEISRLTEILHIKATGLSSVEQGKKTSIMTDEVTTMSTLVGHETPRRSVEEKREGPDKAIWATSTPLPSSTTRDAVGASPVDIARAYMGSRTSEVGMSLRSVMSKDESESADEFITKPIIPMPSPKPICWPGATVQHQRGYMTPQNERGKLGLHNFPRTPYSRTIFSKSKSKLDQLQDGSIGLNTSSTPFRQFNTPLSEKVTSRAYGSVGPIRRIRHKVDEIPRGSVGLNSLRHDSSNGEKSSVYAGLSPASKNLESWVTSSTSKFHSVEIKPRGYEVGHITVPSQSSQIARKILDHIDQKKPTLAEKSAEVKLAIESKRPLSSEVTNSLIRENSNLPTVETVASQKNINVDRQTFSAQSNDYAANFSSKTQREESSHEANNEGNQNSSSSNLLFGNAGGSAEPSFDFSNNGNFQIKNMNEKSFMGFDKSRQKEKNEIEPRHSYMNGQDLSKKVPNSTGSEKINLSKPRSNASSNKPVLPFISINKPSLAMASQNSGFTFPVSSTSGVLSELPTPSIMPSLISASGQTHAKSAEIPTYTFGSRRSDPPLVFSFPTTRSVSANTDASEIKFSFGSDKNARVSFSCC